MKIPDSHAYFAGTGFNEEHALSALFFERIVVPLFFPPLLSVLEEQSYGWVEPGIGSDDPRAYAQAEPLKQAQTTAVIQAIERWNQIIKTSETARLDAARIPKGSVTWRVSYENFIRLRHISSTLEEAREKGWVDEGDEPIRPYASWLFNSSGWPDSPTADEAHNWIVDEIESINRDILKIPNLITTDTSSEDRHWIGGQELASDLGRSIVEITVPGVRQLGLLDIFEVRHRLTHELLAFRSAMSSFSFTVRKVTKEMKEAGVSDADRVALQEVFDTQISPSLREIRHYLASRSYTKRMLGRSVVVVKGILRPFGYFFPPANLAGDTITAGETLTRVGRGQPLGAPDSYGDFGFLVSLGKEVEKVQKKREKERRIVR